MSDVVLAIGGREYTMACAAGEEAHIAELGQMLHNKLSTLPRGSGSNDSRSLLFAALLVADELFELRKSAGGQPSAGPAAEASGELEAVAARLEALADTLERSLA